MSTYLHIALKRALRRVLKAVNIGAYTPLHAIKAIVPSRKKK